MCESKQVRAGRGHLQDAALDAVAVLRRPDAVCAERGAGVQGQHKIDGLAAVPAATEERRKPPYCGEGNDRRGVTG